MALHAQLDAHLQKVVGQAGYSVSGQVATLSVNLSRQRLLELIDVADQLKHDVVAVAGVLKVQPK